MANLTQLNSNQLKPTQPNSTQPTQPTNLCPTQPPLLRFSNREKNPSNGTSNDGPGQGIPDSLMDRGKEKPLEFFFEFKTGRCSQHKKYRGSWGVVFFLVEIRCFFGWT